MDQNLKLKIDSSQARADLAELAKALDLATASAGRMQAGLASGVDKSNASLQKAARNMETFAKIATTVSKVKLSGDPARAAREFAEALNALARVREIRPTTLTGFAKFLEVGYRAQKLNFGSNAFAGIHSFSTAMNAVAAIRTIPQAKLKSYVDFIEIAARSSRLRMGGSGAAGIEAFGRAMDSIARARSISPSRMAALKDLLTTLANAKSIPNANAIARDLDHIASAATRAGAALNALPRGLRGLGGMFGSAAQGGDRFGRSLKPIPAEAERSRRSISALGVAVGSLTGRFNLAYQAGTVFSAMFSAFTFGQLIRGVYDTSIQMLKLEKAMLFLTGSFAGAEQASREYLAIADELGMRALANADAYGRFAISSRAIGASMEDVNSIFRSATLALTAVGASTQQFEYAFYGLSQAMAKGKITSEEFNRQIGEQIPGNVAAGVRALERLTGRQQTAADLFEQMRLGNIQSLPFLRAWAEEIEAMFEPLLGQARNRPDFQLNRLMNVWDRFKVAVGDAGFIGELTTQFRRLADIFIVGEGESARLSDTAQRLADSFGKGLADVVRALGDGLVWLSENLDLVIGGLKALLAFSVASTIAGWTRSMTGYAQRTLEAAAANRVLTVSEVEKATAGAVANGSAAAGSASAPLGGFGRGERVRPGVAPVAVAGASAFSQRGQFNYADLRARGMSHEDAMFFGASGSRPNRGFARQPDLFRDEGRSAVRTQFGRRAPFVPPVVMAGAPAAAGAGAGAARAAGAASLGARVMAPISAFARILPIIGVAALGATVALAAFGDRLTGLKTEANNDVNYNDLAGGIGREAVRGIGSFFNDFARSLGNLFGAANGKVGGFTLAEWLAAVATGIITLGRAIFTVFTTIGKVIGTALGNVVGDVIAMKDSIGYALTGRFGRAGEVWRANQEANQASTAELIESLGRDWGGVFDVQGTFNRILEGAEQSADARAREATESEAASAAAAAANAQIEAALAAQRAADAQARAAAELEEAVTNFSQAMQPLRFDRLMAEIDILQTGRPLEGRAGSPLNNAAIEAGAPAAGGRTWDSVRAAQEAAAAAREPGRSPEAARRAAAESASNQRLADKIQRMPENIGIVLQQVADQFGVDSAVLIRMAARESDANWNPRSYNPTTGASGLFQFIPSTERRLEQRYGAFDPMDPRQAATMALRLFTDDRDYVRRQTGRELSLGESYITHFLGGPGAARLLQAAEADPTGSAAALLPAAARANRSVFYRDGVARTNADLRDELLAQNGGAGGGSGSAAAGAAALMGSEPVEGDAAGRLFERRQNSFRGLDTLLGTGNAGLRAIAEYQGNLERLSDILDVESEVLRRGGEGAETFITEERQEALRRTHALWIQQVEDGLNPLAREMRLAEQSNAVMALRARGLDDEAQWQEHVNDLREQGFDVDMMQDEARWTAYLNSLKEQGLDIDIERLTVTPAEMAAQRDRTDALQAEIDLRRTLLDIEVQRRGRLGSAREGTIAQLIGGQAREGEDFAQTEARLTRSGAMGSIIAQADAIEGERRAGVLQTGSEYAAELAATARLNPSQRAYRDDYKSYLQELTGLTSDSLARLEAEATDADRAWARYMADIQYAADNPPGFQRWADSLAPVAERLQDIKTEFAEGLSDSITDSLMGEDVDWREMLRNTQRSMLKVFVDQQLAGLFGRGSGQGPAAPGAANDNQTGGLLGGIMGALGIGGGATGGDASTGPAATQTITAGTVYLNAANVVGGVGGAAGGLGALVGGLTGGAGAGPITGGAGNGLMGAAGAALAAIQSGALGGSASGAPLPGLPGAAPAGGGNFLQRMGGRVEGFLGMENGLGMGIAGGLLGLLLGDDEEDKPQRQLQMPPGIIGEMRAINTEGTAVGAKSNPWASILNMGLQAFTGNFGAGGGWSLGSTLGNMGSSMSGNLGKLGGFLGGFFEEGGYATSAVTSKVMHPSTWANAPHYAQGTPNTSGIPAILHPDEAVIPLSRGRKVPVEMDNVPGGGNTTIAPVFNIQTPNADSFRQSQGSMTRKVNRDLKRANARNAAG